MIFEFNNDTIATMYYRDLEHFKDSCGYTIDGIWYPRVTSITSIKAKPGLYRYYAGLPDFRTAEAIKNKSAEEGTLTHNTIEGILRDKGVVIPESIKPAINAFLEFSRSHDLVVHKIEERVVSKNLHYAGTMDLLAEINGTLGVVDIKTSYSIFRDYNIQTSAYIQALKENPTLPLLTRWILRIDQSQKCLNCSATLRTKGGNIKIRNDRKSCQHNWSPLRGEWELKELRNFNYDIKAFMACKSLWEWENSYWLRQVKK